MGQNAQRASLARALVVTAGATLVLGGCLGWRQVDYGPTRTAYNPRETALTPATIGQVEELWSVAAGPELRLLESGGLLHYWQDGPHALDLATGQEVWSEPVTDPPEFPLHGQPVLHDGSVYVSSLVPTTECDGSYCWVVSCVSQVLAWDAASGEAQPDKTIRLPGWSSGEQGTCVGPDVTTAPAFGEDYAVFVEVRHWSPFPQTDASLVVHKWSDGSTTRIDPDGEPVQLDSGVGVPVLDEAGGRVFAGHSEGQGGAKLGGWALDGSPLWSVEAGLPNRVGLDGDTLYVLGGGVLANRDPATGATRWGLSFPDAQGLVVRDQVSYFARAEELEVGWRCVSLTCSRLWAGDLSDDIVNGAKKVVAAGDLVYVLEATSGTSTIDVFAAGGCGEPTCDPAAVITVAGEATDVVVADGKILVSTTTGVHAFGLPS